jgi:uncharacterized Fe-S cluster-containing MiaB family protein
MFIKSVMKEILRPISERYLEDIKRAQTMSAEEIYDELLTNMNLDGDTFDTAMHGTVALITPGCSYNINKGIHCGCSFCDWNESHMGSTALAFTLRQKNISLYKNMQFESFARARSTNQRPNIMEEIAVHNCFDDSELSFNEISELFKKNIFSDKPTIGLLQVRAKSITPEKIEKWKPFFKKVLTLGIGVETGDEWIRLHWLNKRTYNFEIEKAINIIHESNCYASANVLISLPGFSYHQNKHHLHSSLKYLNTIGIDSIMISPLINKRYTIQNYFIEQSVENGNRRLYELLESLYDLQELDANIQEKIMFSILNFNEFFNKIEISEELVPLVDEICDLLTIGKKKNIYNLVSKIESFRKSDGYSRYLEDVKSQPKWDEIKSHLINQASILCNKLFTDDVFKIHSEFIDEVEKWI